MRGEDADVAEGANVQKIAIAGDDENGVGGERTGEHVIIVGIARGGFERRRSHDGGKRPKAGDTGLQAHHLIEKRFAGLLGQNARQRLSVAVTQAEHQAFTNAWREAIPYGAGTANATKAQIMNAARQI